MTRITVFISYTWDSEAHKEWVLCLANNLRTNHGLNVLLDQFELQAGRQLTYFMEHSIAKADKVLVIMTPSYKQKADQRKGGAGFEYSLISQALMESPAVNSKIVPVLREGTNTVSGPTIVQTLIYHDLRKDEDYDSTVFKMGRELNNKPEIKQAPLGDIPDYDIVSTDPLLSRIKHLTATTSLNQELDALLDSPKGVELAYQEVQQLFTMLAERAVAYSAQTDLKFLVYKDQDTAISVTCQKHSITHYWANTYRNTLQGAYLEINQWYGRVTYDSMTVYFPGDQPKVSSTAKYEFNLDSNGSPVWISGKTSMTTKELANSAFAHVIEQITNERKPRFRN